MKTIKVTHIDTGGHGYLSVSKQDFIMIMLPSEVSGYSGHTLTRIYLEEDRDASVFMSKAEAAGYTPVVKSSYNLSFDHTHNYKADLFDWRPEVGGEVKMHDELWYKISEVQEDKAYVVGHGKKYRLPLTNPFKWFTEARPASRPEHVEVAKVLNQLTFF